MVATTRRARAAAVADHLLRLNPATGALARRWLCFVQQLLLGVAMAAAPHTALASGMNLHGQTGLLEVPTAQPIAPGSSSVYLGQREHAAAYDNYQIYGFTLGYWPELELVGRIVEISTGTRDLSGDFKWRLIKQAGFSLALGAQDFAGEAQNFRTRYLVATQELGPLSLTAGYGDELDRLRGAFGGVQLSLGPWVDLIADHDAEQLNAGVRLNLGSGDAWQVSALAARELEDERSWAGVLNLQWPLGYRASGGVAADNAAAAARVVSVGAAVDGWAVTQHRLIVAGLDDVYLGEATPGTARLIFDGARYPHSHLDALGVALAVMARDLPSNIEILELVQQSNGIPQMFLRSPRAAAEAWLGHELSDGQWRQAGLAVRYAQSRDADPRQMVLRVAPSGRANPLTVSLEPQLRSFVATEMGVLDVDLGARLRGSLALGAGARLNASLIAPIYRTDDFDNPATFGNQRVHSGLDQLLLQKLIAVQPGWRSHVATGFMRVQNQDTGAVLHEQMLTSASGRLQWRVYGGYFFNHQTSRSIGLTELNTWFPAQDISLKLAAGRFIAGDNGVRAELSRYFGDTAIHLFWRAQGRFDQAGGLGFSMPIGPRRAPKAGPVMVAGDPAWNHRVSTTINAADQRNPLRPALLREELPDWDIEQDGFDRGRLAPAWVLNHLSRLREAAWEFARD